MKTTTERLILALIYLFCFTSPASAVTKDAVDVEQSLALATKHMNMLAQEKNIGLRSAGSDGEKAAAEYIKEQFLSMGIAASIQEFNARSTRRDFGKSRNVAALVPAVNSDQTTKTLIIGAHFDTSPTPQGSLGAVDNAASIGVMLSVAANFKNLSVAKRNNKLNILFLAFGAEEVGLLGAKYYVDHHLENLENVIGMVNLDSMVGGDNLYIHSPLNAGYNCYGKNVQSNPNPVIRDALLSVSDKLFGDAGYMMHPAYDGYPEGETGQWSDHAPFACAGIPVAHMEATNFTIKGRNGNDGYSNSIHPELWDCFNTETMGACDPDTERKWGMIWHGPADRIEVINRLFPGRIDQQMTAGIRVLSEFLIHADDYLPN